MRPTVDQLEHSGEYECVESVRHESIHRWLRQHLFTIRFVAGTYWLLNLAVLLYVLVLWRRSGMGLLDALPIICMGMVGGFLVLLPIHENIHALAYRLVGVRNVHIRYELRRVTALCVAPGEVLEARSFIGVCLAPLIALNPLLAVSTLLVPGGAPALALAGALLLHTGACSGDVAFVQYLCSRRPQRLFTFDDHRQPISYFYSTRAHAGAATSQSANTPVRP